jgi:putative ABC transport system permease protein
METIARDVRFALRMLIKRPGFTILAVICLALGIGASAAIFSVVNGVLLRPLPFPDANRLLAWGSAKRMASDISSISGPDYVDMRAGSTHAELAVYTGSELTLRSGDAVTRLRGASVSSNLFHVLGIAPRLGRAPSLDEELPKRGNVVVLSDGLWRRTFGADPKMIGRVIRLDASDYTVIGVMPKGFSFPLGSDDVDAWTPLTLAGDSAFAEQRGSHYLSGVARIAPHAGVDQLSSELKAIAQRLSVQYPGTNHERTANVKDLQEYLVGSSQRALFVLAGAVACLLLIACANVANLMLARASIRAKEVAVRTAIGASRSSILRQVLTESILLALMGGVVGLLLAAWGADLLLAIAPRALPRIHEIGLDWRVVGFTAFVAIATGLVFGIAPALQLSGSELNDTLKEGGRAVTGAGRANRLRASLVIAEVALSLILLAGAGLLSATLLRLQRVDPGFDATDVLTARLALPEATYKTGAQQAAFYDQLIEKARAIPGVQSVGAVSTIPLSRERMTIGFSLADEPRGEGIAPAHGEALDVVSPDFFESMRIPVKMGRPFTVQDDSAAPLVMIVNEAFAKKYWPGQHPVGQRVSPGYDSDSLRTVIGVVGNVRRDALETDAAPAMYLPYRQAGYDAMALTIRTRDNATNVADALRRAVASLDPDQALGTVRSMESVRSESLSRQRFSASLLGIFATIALALSAVGIFGVMSAMVTQRTRELAVRLALGANPRRVLQLVMSQGAVLAGAGIVIGLFGAFLLSRVVAGMLYDVAATDPATLFGVSLLLAAVALLACYIPARRATRVDPIITLREE